MPSHPKPTLLTQISRLSFLKKAWRLLNTSNKKSSGLSRSSIKEYESNLNNNLIALSRDLLSGKYEFSAVKGVALKKKTSGHRPLLISEVRDRIVHKALALKVEGKLSKKYKLKNSCSFAYQKELSIQDAIIQMISYYKEGYHIILEADIKNFFPSVNKEQLLNDIYNNLPDASINNLLHGSLNQALGNIEELKQKDIEIYNDIFLSIEDGIPQGNALSPLFANIYLSKFDQRMIKAKMKMIRYADDFIIMCRSKEDAKRAYQIAVDELQDKLKLTVYPLKEFAEHNEKISRILNPKEAQFSFLSIKFDGHKCSVIDKKIINLLLKLNEFTSIESIKKNYPNEDLGLLQILTKVKNSLEGWVAAYNFLEISNLIREIDKHVNIILLHIFEGFGFKLRQKDRSRIRTQKSLKIDANGDGILRRNGNEKIGISNHQRKSLGIPLCLETYAKSKPPMSINDRVKAHMHGLDKVSRGKSAK